MKKHIWIPLVVVLVLAVGCGAVFLPGMVARLLADSHVQKADAYAAAARYDEAVTEYTRALERNAENGDAYYGLALALRERGDLESAIDAARTGYDKTADYRLFYCLRDLETAYKATVLSEENIDTLPRFVLDAVCAYYGLESRDALTVEMLESVTSLRLTLRDYKAVSFEKLYVKDEENPPYDTPWRWDDIPAEDAVCTYYIDATINDSWFDLYYSYIRPDRMKSLQSQITNEWLWEKFDSFYIRKDIDDADMDEVNREKMLEAFPYIATCRQTYLLERQIKRREWLELTDILQEYSEIGENFRFDDYIVPREVDLSALKILPNLESITYFIDTSYIDAASAATDTYRQYANASDFRFSALHFRDLAQYKAYVGLTFIGSPVPVTEVVGPDPFYIPQED